MGKNKVNEMVRRNYEFEVRAERNEEANEYIIVGRPIVYNSRTDLGYFDEIIERGALDEADLTDVRFLVNHDTSKIPLARSRRNNENSTMQLFVDANGMTIRVKLDVENNSEARNLYSAIQRGDITGMSFMFGIREQDWSEMDTDHPTRHITKISTVIEVSAVTFPAYEDTEISARDKSALDSARRALDSVQRRAVDTAINYKAKAIMRMLGTKERG
ncbi:HK97 family phage prohead protease [Massilicoli timonensis]|uniref:HK97 family phage prohead protease n=1 Tax=Massilicoli timonensis TaxID=2015901 RepID=UPI003AB07ED7